MNIIKALGKRETVLYEFIEECKKQKANLEINFIYYYDRSKKEKSEYYRNHYQKLFYSLLNDYEYMKKERRKYEKGDYDYWKEYGDCISCLSELTIGDAESWDMDIKGDKINITLNYDIYGYTEETYNYIGDEIIVSGVSVAKRCSFSLHEVSNIHAYKNQHRI